MKYTGWDSSDSDSSDSDSDNYSLNRHVPRAPLEYHPPDEIFLPTVSRPMFSAPAVRRLKFRVPVVSRPINNISVNLQAPKVESTRPQIKRRTTPLICYNCNGLGHYSPQCPSPKKRPKYNL